MATTPKGFTQIAATDKPDGPAQINGAELFVENLIGEHVSTSSALPSPGVWQGRTIFVEDTNSMYVWTGSAWQLTFAPMQTFTPDWQGLSVGSGGSSYGVYHVANGIAEVYVSAVLGSSPTFNDPHLTLPIAVASGYALDRGWLGSCVLIDDSAGASGAHIGGVSYSAGTGRLMSISSDVMSALMPFTWATGDRFTVHLSYPV